MPKKVLYVTDLDGTLLNRQDRISDYSLSVINRLVREGMTFTYATARSLSSASIVTKGLVLNCPAVVYNGVFIKNVDTGHTYFSNTFLKEEAFAIQKMLERNKVYPLVYSLVDGMEKVFYLKGKENEGIRRYLSLRKEDKRFLPCKGENDLYKGDIFYFTLIGEKEELSPVYGQLKDHPSLRCIFQQELYREEYWCEIMPKKATKANGALKLKEMLECDEIISFGDAVNDIPMFEISDACYAVENAVDELKEKAKGIIGENEKDGVAKWLLEHYKG